MIKELKLFGLFYKPVYICSVIKTINSKNRTMKRTNVVKSIAAGLFMLSALTANAQEKGSLTVNIEGLRNNNGMVMIALTEKEIPTDMNYIGANMAQADSTGMKFFFKQLPATTVYIQVFHDENGNFRMDTTPEGKPAEGVGTSPAQTGRPSAVITVGENSEAKINISYF